MVADETHNQSFTGTCPTCGQRYCGEDIQRMLAALEQLAELGEQGMKPNYNEWLTFHDKVAQVARAALSDSNRYPLLDAAYLRAE